MAEKYERHFRIPKFKLIRRPPDTSAMEFLQFAIQIHCNNLGLIGVKVIGISSFVDINDAYVISFECIDIVDELEQKQMQDQLQKMASEDIDGYFENMVKNN